MRIIREEADDLLSGDAPNQGIAYAVSRQIRHHEVRKAVHDLAEEPDQGGLQRGLGVGAHSVVGLHNNVAGFLTSGSGLVNLCTFAVFLQARSQPDGQACWVEAMRSSLALEG